MMPFVVFQSLWNAVTRVVTLFYVVLGGSVLVSRAGSILVSGEALTALLLKQMNLRVASVKILHAMGRIAHRIHQDPTELSTLALHGVADLYRFVSRGEIDAIRAAIDAEFMGAGDALRDLIDVERGKDPDRTQPLNR